jgi:membrane fusion protein, multidrug efflux system
MGLPRLEERISLRLKSDFPRPNFPLPVVDKSISWPDVLFRSLAYDEGRMELSKIFIPGRINAAFSATALPNWKKVLVTSVALFYMGCSRTDASETDTNANASQSKSVRAKIVAASVQEVAKYLEATGTFQADETTKVAPATSGKVAQTLVKEGDFVKAGDVIARLDQKDANLRLQQAQASENQARAQLAQAEAQLRQAQANLGLDKGGNFSIENVPSVRQARATLSSKQSDLTLAETTERRYTSLLETGDTSRLLVDQQHNETEKARAAVNESREALGAAENSARQSNQTIEASRANVRNAQASLQNAEAATALAVKTVADTAIRAPFAGYVSARSVAPGEYVSQTTAIATIVRTKPIKVRLQIPEKEAGNIRAGMSVSASVAAFPDRNFAGRVAALNPVLSETARSLQVEAVFENSDNLLRPGMFATARVLQPEGEKGIFIPNAAVIVETNTNSLGVYVIDADGTARLRTIQIDESTRDNEQIRILSGVSEGERVATTNTEQLFDGAKAIADL